MALDSTISVSMETSLQNCPEDSDDVEADLAELLDVDCVPESDPEPEDLLSLGAPTAVDAHALQSDRRGESVSDGQSHGLSNARHGPGILDRLLEKGHDKLSGTVAGIVRDAEVAIAHARSGTVKQPNSHVVVNTQSVAKTGDRGKDNFAEMMRKRRQRTSDVPSMTDAQRRKKARNAFAVIGKKAVESENRYEYDDDRFSDMRLREAQYPPTVLSGLFETFNTINIADIPDKAVEIRAGQIKEYMVYGCLVKKVSKKTAKNGKRYAVWMLSNLPLYVKGKPKHSLTSINCLLFDDAFDSLHTKVEGTVFAFRKPRILPPQETLSALSENRAKGKRGHSQWSGYCLSISKASHAQAIGQATNFGICTVESQQGERCGQWYHTHISSLCHFHTKQKLKRQTMTRRPEINTAERPGATRADFAGTSCAVNISRVEMSDIVASKFKTDTVVKDEEQRFRDRRDLQKAEKLRMVAVGRKMQTGRSCINSRETLAQHEWGRKRERALSTRTGFGNVRLQHRTQTRSNSIALSATSVDGNGQTGSVRLQTPISTQGRCISAQERYRNARDTLVELGFTILSDGSFAPPTAQSCRENGVKISVNDRGAESGRNALSQRVMDDNVGNGEYVLANRVPQCPQSNDKMVSNWQGHIGKKDGVQNKTVDTETSTGGNADSEAVRLVLPADRSNIAHDDEIILSDSSEDDD